MVMADIHCYHDNGSSNLFHSSPEEMIHIQIFDFYYIFDYLMRISFIKASWEYFHLIRPLEISLELWTNIQYFYSQY